MEILSERLRLRPWREGDRAAFAALNADAEVMQDLGRPLDHARSDAKFDRFSAAFERQGYCRWLVERIDGVFLGYTGMMQSDASHPLGPHVDIGWRLVRDAWGQGYATEAARSALRDAFERVGLDEVLAYTSADNRRCQAVMTRLKLQRAPQRDFRLSVADGVWLGLVWSARP